MISPAFIPFVQLSERYHHLSHAPRSVPAVHQLRPRDEIGFRNITQHPSSRTGSCISRVAETSARGQSKSDIRACGRVGRHSATRPHCAALSCAETEVLWRLVADYRAASPLLRLVRDEGNCQLHALESQIPMDSNGCGMDEGMGKHDLDVGDA